MELSSIDLALQALFAQAMKLIGAGIVAWAVMSAWDLLKAWRWRA